MPFSSDNSYSSKAVYVDLVTKSTVGLVPKTPFYCLFESLKSNPESRVFIVNAERLVRDGDKLLLKEKNRLRQ